MSKFNPTRRRSSKTTKITKISTKKPKNNQTIQKLVNQDVLRTSKYHKKIESNVRKTIDKDIQA
jgi:hypothetical protein